MEQDLAAQNASQAAEIKRLREALGHYANRENWEAGLYAAQYSQISYAATDFEHGFEVAELALSTPTPPSLGDKLVELGRTIPRLEGAADCHPLSQLMSDISEECWCASWLIGTEFVLWEAVLNGPMDWGQGRINEEQIDTLKALSNRYDCWIFALDYVGEIPITIRSWEKIYASRPKETQFSPEELKSIGVE